ncbi:MAG: division/cell wall cluster transcriptional repressor MraZ [Candidatus Adiutrix sp.]
MATISEHFSFVSEFVHSLDDKGRLALPNRLREELQKSERPDEMTAYANEDGCVALYPFEQWVKIQEKLSEIPNTRARMATIREFVGKAERLSIDKSGRILLSPKQRELAGLSREVLVLGAISKIELWERQRLAQQRIKEETMVSETINTVDIPL